MGDRYYSYDPEEGFDEHATAEAAERAAYRALDGFRGDADESGWPSGVADIHWGRLLPLGMAAATEGAGDDGEPWTDYHIASQPDELVQLRAERDALRARVAELEAPPVVPEGWEVVGVPYQLDHDEYETRWELWVRDVDGGPITVAHVDRGNVCHPSGIDEPFAAFRALMWAAEHDAIPPHAGDEVPAIRGVCGDTCTSGNECGRIGCPECQQ